MNYDRLEFPDADDDLARRAGIEVPRETQQRNENSDAKELFGALEAAAPFFRKHLAGSDKARAYLDGRGVDEAIREQFAIDRQSTRLNSGHKCATSMTAS